MKTKYNINVTIKSKVNWKYNIKVKNKNLIIVVISSWFDTTFYTDYSFSNILS